MSFGLTCFPHYPYPRRAVQTPLQSTTPITPSQQAPLSTGQKVSELRKARAGCEIVNNNFRPHVLAHDHLRVWSSPYSIEHQRTFGNELPADVMNRTYTTLLGSYAPGTRDNYAAGLLKFHQFCD
jgi:hypothetical protein